MTLDGPFTVSPSALVRYITDLASYAANTAALQPYRDATTPLKRVWAGDDAANPQWTVALAFADQATADSVIAGLV